MDDEQVEALVELGILRQAGSMIKVQSAIDIAQEVLEQGESIVLFTAYQGERKEDRRGPHAELISGEVIGKARQDIIDRFQSKKNACSGVSDWHRWPWPYIYSSANSRAGGSPLDTR